MYINILQNGEEEKSYVVVGAVLCCTMGSTPSQLQLPCSYGLYIKGKPQMSIMDYQPHVNVLPFGICAKGMPCSPSLFMPWINGISNKSVGDFPSLSNQSITLCASGGIIQIQEDGQGGSDVLTGSRKVENNLGFFEQLAKMGSDMKAGVYKFGREIGPATSLERLAEIENGVEVGLAKFGREIGPATRHTVTELTTLKNYIPLTRELVGPERFDTITDSSKPMSERAKAGLDIAASFAENAGPGKIGKATRQISKLGNIPPTHFSNQNHAIPSNSTITQKKSNAGHQVPGSQVAQTTKTPSKNVPNKKELPKAANGGSQNANVSTKNTSSNKSKGQAVPNEKKLPKVANGSSEYNNASVPTRSTNNQGTPKPNGNVGTPPRYGNRQITDEEYKMLRDETPTPQIRKQVNKGHDKKAVTEDPVLPGKTFKGSLEADHIVPMDKITRMDGFGKLTEKQKLEVLNNPENFIGLSKSANTSRKTKSYEEWTHYKKDKPGQIEVNPDFRNKMIKKERELERKLQQQIDDFNRKNNR
ncbi:uncharacterized protein DUF4280 [Aneurinibacillus soli]|uniref:Uncharacterized protein n=1 Tax=Aneurinibacillus soli TaxID=1500254 RepID=A0A0U5AY88_9BACL|nr:PAAR-like protein [Aneurinibacillus soli]PYE60382.1 uncharacterized protein DUF4280 [Aneurinibacillus soli]BAU27218.1 hypothetical protein CB4_01387 [Aneurinibacillus soli]